MSKSRAGRRTFAAAVVLAVASSWLGAARAGAGAPVLGFRVLESWRHDPSAYTEGLSFDKGVVFESTGLNGHSSLRKVALRTGRVLASVTLAQRYYAEGTTVWNGLVYQLTLEHGVGFIYDERTLHREGTFSYEGEGWGLTHDAGSLILSDGTDTLRFLDPATSAVRRTLRVRDAGVPVESLNELEVVDNSICANVFPTSRIACIDPRTGAVRYWIDLTGILPRSLQPNDEEAVLNGIAWGGHRGRLLVTGKYWPRLFEIQVVRR